MNNHQRGIYQPLMENIPIYDLSDEDVDDEERSRLPLLIVIALVVLAAFAGVVWLAYNQGVARGRASAAVIIAAPPGPVRTAPVDAGGTATPYTGLTVYGQPLAPIQEAQSSTLAPVPPPPVIANSSVPAIPAPPAVQSVPRPAAASDVPPIRLTADTRAATAARPAPPAVQAAKPAVPATPKPAVRAAAEPATPAPTRSALAGGAVLQLGAYDSLDIANGAWTTFKSRHSDVAGTLSQDVQKVDLGPKGTWYRLRVGPFADRAAAATACEKLRADGASCFVAAP